MPKEDANKNMHSNSKPHDAHAPLPSHQPNRIPANSDGNNDQQDQKCRCNGRSNTHEKWVITWAAVTAVITLSSVCIAFLQWRSMDRQIEEMRRQFRVDQRPYVMPANWTPHLLEPGQPIRVSVSWINSGKSPAIKVRGRGKIFFGLNALEEAEKWFNVNERTSFAGAPETIVPPGVPADWSDAQVTTYKTRGLTQGEFNTWRAGNLKVVIVGRNEYFDGAGNQYWTDSCLLYSLNEKTMQKCATHNEID